MKPRCPTLLSLVLPVIALPLAALGASADMQAPAGSASQILRVADTKAWEPPLADDAPGDMPAPESDEDSIGRGIGTILDNLFQEMEPALDQITEGLDQAGSRLGPVLGDLGRLVDDVRNYQAPERLPNGDILIRRKPDAPEAPEIGQSLRDLATPQDEDGQNKDGTARRKPDPAPKAPGRLPTLPRIEL